MARPFRCRGSPLLPAWRPVRALGLLVLALLPVVRCDCTGERHERRREPPESSGSCGGGCGSDLGTPCWGPDDCASELCREGACTESCRPCECPEGFLCEDGYCVDSVGLVECREPDDIGPSADRAQLRDAAADLPADGVRDTPVDVRSDAPGDGAADVVSDGAARADAPAGDATPVSADAANDR